MLCLLGYRGKGYSESFCENMTEIYEKLRLHPETLVEIIEGPDDICRAYPADQHSHCEDPSVFDKDGEILRLLGAQIGDKASWSVICEAVKESVQPGDIGVICSNCRWEPYGLCKEGVSHIHGDGTLRPLPKT